MVNYTFKTILLSFSVLFFSTKIFSAENVPSSGSFAEENTCPLLGPDNFAIMGTTSTSIAASWSPVQGAVDYWLHVEEEATGTVVFAGTVGGTDNIVQNLTPNTTYILWSKGVCPNMELGAKSAVKSAKTDYIIIQDIVPKKTITPNYQLPPCISLTPTNSTITLKAVNLNQASQPIASAIGIFELVLVPDPTPTIKVIHKREPFNNYMWIFTNSQNQLPYSSNFPVYDNQIVKVFYGSPDPSNLSNFLSEQNQVLQFNITRTPNIPIVEVNFCWHDLPTNPLNSAVWSETPGFNGGGSGGGTEGKAINPSIGSNSPSTDKIYPNPFGNEVNIELAKPSTGSTTLRLFNLNGQQLVEHQVQEGSNEVHLVTDGLVPGAYLLRLDTEEGTQTFKLIKAN